MQPSEVNTSNAHTVLSRLRKLRRRLPQTYRNKFGVGDKVHVSKYKRTFTMGYLANWTNEVFTVDEVRPTVPVTYLISDNKGTVPAGGFYGHELLKTTVGDVYLIEKVLQRRGDRLKVRWMGFDGKHDTWIKKGSRVENTGSYNENNTTERQDLSD